MTNSKIQKPTGPYKARFENLVDIAVNGQNKLVYVVVDRGKLIALEHVDMDNERFRPPPVRELPWARNGLPTWEGIERAFSEDEPLLSLVGDIRNYITPLVALPDEDHATFLALWICCTYLADHPDIDHLGILLVFGNRERGKGRLLRAAGHLVYRAALTETVNEATIFRLAERLGVTIMFDVSNLWTKVSKRGSDDLLLLRFEKGGQVVRVTRPEAGPFADMDYYDIYGPTAIATNEQLPDVMASRCFPIAMPVRPANYPSPDAVAGRRLRERLLAFRARMMGESLPPPEIVGSGRWQDICAPITQLAVMANANVIASVTQALDAMSSLRSEQTRDSLEARVVQALINCGDQVAGGRIASKILRHRLNGDDEDRFKASPQKVGRIISAFGFDKSSDRQYILWDNELVEALRRQYGL